MAKIRRDPETIAEFTDGTRLSAHEDLGGMHSAPEPTEISDPEQARPIDPDQLSLVPTVDRWNTLTQQEKDEARKVARMAINQLKGVEPDTDTHMSGQQTLFE